MRCVFTTQPALGGILVVEPDHAGFYSEVPVLAEECLEAVERRVEQLYHVEEMSADYFLQTQADLLQIYK